MVVNDEVRLGLRASKSSFPYQKRREAERMKSLVYGR